MDPLSIGFGIAQAGLGLFQGYANSQAQQQSYMDQLAFQRANSKFAQWQAGFNAKVNNANNQYKYWAETVNYNQQLAYTKSQRNVELLKAVRQAEVVRDTRAAAGASFLQDSDAIGSAYREAGMQEAVAMQQYKWRSLQARSSVQAMAMEGRSVDRLVNDYARQEGEYATIQQINEGIRNRQYSREQQAQITQYLNRWNSQQFYEEAQVFDPLPPFAPLPTLITPSGPTMTGAAPSGTASMLGIGSSLLGGFTGALGMQQQLNQLRIGGS